MRTFAVSASILVCMILFSCGGESFSPGEMRYTWNPTFADLYINDKLALRGDFLLDHGSGASVTVKAVMHPEDGWQFANWYFKKENGLFTSPDVKSYEENPLTFNVDDNPQHLYLKAVRFQVDDYTVSDTEEKIFMTFRNTGNKRAGIYSLRDKTLSFFEDERYTDYTIDPFGRAFCLDRELGVMYILDWEKEEFEELLTDFPSTVKLGGIDDEAYSFSWSPDMTKCAYIYDNYEVNEYSLCILDRASGTVKTKQLLDTWIDELKWPLDSKFLYSMEILHTTNGLSHSRIIRYKPDSLLETEICTYPGTMKNLSGPDEFGNFYFYDNSNSSNSKDNIIIRMNEEKGTAATLFSFDDFDKITGENTYEYSRSPTIRQHRKTITITTDKAAYAATFNRPALLFFFSETFFMQGDTILILPNSNIFIVKTLSNYAEDLYLCNFAGEEERITKPECFL